MDQLSTVSKALQVLQAFSYEHPVMGVSELSRKLNIGKSSVHRVLCTLAEQGFVAKTDDDRYRLGLLAIEVRGERAQLGVETLALNQRLLELLVRVGEPRLHAVDVRIPEEEKIAARDLLRVRLTRRNVIRAANAC